MIPGLSNLSRNQLIGIIVVAVLALILGIWLSMRAFGPPPEPANTVFSPSLDIASFNLTDTNGRAFDNAALQDHWTFLFFGFTNCPSICPTTMATLNQMYQILLNDKQNPMPRVVMVSIDPDNDTPVRLQQYVSSFNPNFVGAIGSKEDIDQLTSSLNIVYTKVQTSENPQGYTIDHSGAVLLIDPTGRLISIFSPPLDAATMANDFQLIVESSG